MKIFEIITVMGILPDPVNREEVMEAAAAGDVAKLCEIFNPDTPIMGVTKARAIMRKAGVFLTSDDDTKGAWAEKWA